MNSILKTAPGFMFSAFLIFIIMPEIFAESDKPWENESIINVSIIGNSIIDLDSNDTLIRAYVDITNYNPADGYYMMRVIQIPTNQIIYDKEIVIREKSNGEAGADVAYMINTDDILQHGTDVLGDYTIEIYSEEGTAIGQTFFSLISSVEQLKELKAEQLSSQNVSENSNEQNEIEEVPSVDEIKKIPDWIKNIFILYADGSITENELISALAFLIEQGIIVIE